MSRFYCKCGHESRSSEITEDEDGVLFWVDDLTDLENNISVKLIDYLALTEQDDKLKWIKSYFGEQYIENPSFSDVVEDLISLEVNSSKYRSTFKCSVCGRLAIFDGNKWIFYKEDS